MDNFWIIVLALYALGVGCSQSLMSLGGTFVCLGVLWGLYTNFPKDRLQRVSCLSVFLWVLYSHVNHLVRGWGPYTQEALKNMPLFLVLIFPFLSKRLSPRALAGIFSCYAAGALASVVFASYQFFYLKYYGMGFFHNQIYFAYNLLPAFLFFTELAIQEKNYAFWKANYSRLLSAIIFLGIFTTNNRMSSLIVLLYVLFRALPWVYKKWGLKYFSAVVVSMTIFFVAIFYLNPFVYDKISQSMMGLRDVSVKSRIFAWTENWKIFLSNPFFGVGFSNNALDSAYFVDFQGNSISGRAIYAHSIYFQHLADSGIIGFLLLIASLVLLLLNNPMTRVLIIGVMIAGLTENIFNNSKAFHSFLVFTILSLWVYGEGLPQVGAKRSLRKSS